MAYQLAEERKTIELKMAYYRNAVAIVESSYD